MDALSRYEPIIDDFEGFLAACERPLPTTVRVNPLAVAPDRAVEALAAEGVAVDRREWHPGVLEVDTNKPGNTWPYVHGWVHGQEEVSCVPPRVLDPEPGDVVWDACAAPGGKTAQIAAEIDDDGLVVANDDNLGRLSALRGNCDRLGVTSAAVTNTDARRATLDAFPDVAAVDAALVDAPCSCEGTIRKNADALDGAGASASRSLGRLQADILARAVALTRPGGTVVYSTCTFAPEENEAVVDEVLGRTDSRLVEFDVGLASAPGLTEWGDASYDDSLARAQRYYPHHNDTGGFFAAKLEVTV
ncbi:MULTISPECIES: RsmB/NOP family class I SAM-dependent RNA methyltransferase [Halobacterium]|uniref:RsmB/NOP family class I SAM-dependent RNA methyltransferase n=1 Tax=Halobacterium TaxID=2239 RepID=UPI001963A0CD|nr:MULTISPECIES: RsmB/NOP family class I SAM-dependent RNA methyltransferase [Halobacterium]MCF2164045.1 RsmB/NOP family class I SAM-dependent RNA methyltransferase [Halobacterium salinarum]MCF2168775.1 RsmB/NOP family class I SAM-dependent RNA methyltransferase [Halobacterium salinarum]MCF2239735.1 RsmB/NOP family class I SAM-dependent RNA methyltransferase [Halobacterium salinarum]QRY23082.1 RsmB/NOP family class I SAM-dependent RNA methyltransferase [Halobacterium sp. GSL-19]